VLWPDLDAQCVSVSEQWGQFSIAGPRSREVLQRIVDEPGAIANEALPYLGVKELSVLGGIGARLFRISFSGEMAFELSLPARFGDGAIRAIMEAGREFAITPYGTEALGVMRIEKGHVAGSELNGQTTARDLGLGKMMSTKKDYVGRVMAGRPGMIDPARPQVIGFKSVARNQRLWSGAHFIAQGAEATMPELAMDAPSFEGIGSRRNQEWMARWIQDPKALRMTAQMPRVLHGATVKEDVGAIAAYLASLKSSEALAAPTRAEQADDGRLADGNVQIAGLELDDGRQQLVDGGRDRA